MKKYIFAILAFALFAQGAAAAGAPVAAVPVSGDKAKLEVFFESMDGQGWQLFFLGDAVRRRIPAVEITVTPLLSKNEKGEWATKRGAAEIDESMRVAIMSLYYADKLPAYLNARSLSPWPDGWRESAAFSGLAPEKLQARVSKDGEAALTKAYNRAQELKIAEATILINGKPYEGQAKLFPLFETVNNVLPKEKRAYTPVTTATLAASAPPAPKFWVVVSSGVEKNDMLIAAFAKYFPGIKPVVLDYASTERAALFPDVTFLPAYALEDTKTVRSTLEGEIKAGIFTESKGSLIYFDKQRKGMYPNSAKEPGVLKLFVMSQCPYGVTAENGLLDAVKNKQLPEGTKIEIHYIGDAAKDEKGAYTFKSLHGTPEWEENARQLVIAKKFPEKFNVYLLERNKDVTSPQWEEAAKKAGINPKDISSAFEEGKTLLAEDFKYTSGLNITTSPSFVWEGQWFVVGMGELAKIKGFEKVVAQGSTGAGCAK